MNPATESEHNARRQAECKEMSEFITTASKEKSEILTKTSSVDTVKPESQASNHVGSITIPSAEVGSKRRSTTGEESRPSKLIPRTDPLKKLRVDVEKERIQRASTGSQLGKLIQKIYSMS